MGPPRPPAQPGMPPPCGPYSGQAAGAGSVASAAAPDRRGQAGGGGASGGGQASIQVIENSGDRGGGAAEATGAMPDVVYNGFIGLITAGILATVLILLLA